MNDIENSRNLRKKQQTNNLSSDNDDIIKQLSQITSNDDKSFESSLTSKNIPILYDMNNYSDVINNNRNLYKNKNIKKTLDEENILINNKHFPLNQKLKYLCSLIQIFNINIKKYDDLQEFSKYFSNDKLKPNQLEPINILFDIISELIFYIQRENKNNDILMKELKIIKHKRADQENVINKLNSKIEEKEREIEEMTSIKNNDDYFKYNLKEKENEINELKKENKELYKKINSYLNQIEKTELNKSQFSRQLESFSTKNKDYINKTISNDLNIRKNICNLYTLNNSYDNSEINLYKKNKSKEKSSTNIYLTKVKERKINEYINLEQSLSPLKTLNNNRSSKIRRIINNNNNDDKKIKDGTIIIKLKLLLKEINDMLNKYNSNLEKINFNKNINGNDNIKDIYDFMNMMNDKINKMKNITEINNDKTEVIYKKSIQVNTSRWKFRKKSVNKNKFKKLNDNLNLNIKRKNTSSCSKKDLLFNKI